MSVCLVKKTWYLNLNWWSFIYFYLDQWLIINRKPIKILRSLKLKKNQALKLNETK